MDVTLLPEDVQLAIRAEAKAYKDRGQYVYLMHGPLGAPTREVVQLTDITAPAPVYYRDRPVWGFLDKPNRKARRRERYLAKLERRSWIRHEQAMGRR